MEIVILSIFAFIVVFVLLREFWCWYFKINARVKLQAETNRLLDALLLKQSNAVQKETINNGILESPRDKMQDNAKSERKLDLKI